MKNYASLLLVLSLFYSAHAQKLSKKEKEILTLVDRNYEASVDFLEKVVNVNSGTHNLKGVREVGALFDTELKKAGLQTRWIDMPAEMKRAGHLFAEKSGTRGKKLLLIGHLDTVFEPDSPFQKWKENDTIAYGPGVNDMKGGNVILLYALRALHDAGALKDASLTVALIGDEEDSGSPETLSRKDLIDAAKRSDYALAFETATGFRSATIARRGYTGWEIRTTGRRAHSSGVFSDYVGAGAIYELTRILNAFYEELPEQYLTFNPGIIMGGSSFSLENGVGNVTGKDNVVAETAVATGDLRFISREQLERAQEKMRGIVAQHLPGTDATITFHDGMPAMPPTDGNYALLAVLDQVSRDMGLGEVKAWDPGRRGAGDISYVAPFISGIDGLGAMGTGAHSLDETINLKTFKDLTKRAALMIYRLTR